MAQEDTSQLRLLYQDLRGAEHHKNSLIEVLLLLDLKVPSVTLSRSFYVVLIN